MVKMQILTLTTTSEKVPAGEKSKLQACECVLVCLPKKLVQQGEQLNKLLRFPHQYAITLSFRDHGLAVPDQCLEHGH